jgi:hypothetical protein
MASQAGSWQRSHVAVVLPEGSFREWRLLVSAPEGTQVRRIESCSIGEPSQNCFI